MFRRFHAFTSRAVVVLSLALTGVVAPVAAAHADTPIVTEAQSWAAAMHLAQAQGNSVEVLEWHTESERVWANADGTWMRSIWPGAQFVDQGDSNWSVVNTSLEFATDGASVVPSNTPADISLSAGGDSSLASIEEVSDQQTVLGLTFNWPTKLPTPELSGNEATYRNVSPGVDLRVAVSPHGVETFVDVHSRPVEIPADGYEVLLPLSLKGLTVQETADGGLQLRDRSGEVVSSTPPALVWDGATNPLSGDPASTLTLPTDLVTTSSGYAVSVKVPASFFDRPDVVWPVTIDPSGFIYANADTYVEKGYNTSNFGASTELRVGTWDNGTHVARSLLHFDFASGTGASLAGATVSSAYLRLWQTYSSSCTNAAVNIRKITSGYLGTGGWSESKSTWNNQPTINTANVVSVSDAAGYSASCPADYLGGAETAVPVTTLIQGWISQPSTNNGLALTAAETGTISWKKFASSEHDLSSKRPRLNVTYTTKPSTPTDVAVSGFASGWTDTLTPTLSAKVADADGSTVRAQFAIRLGQSQVWPVGSGWSDGTTVSSGGTSMAQVPSGILVENQQYTLNVRTTDGTTYSSISTAAVTFSVDAQPMETPSVTCTGVTFGQLTEVPPAYSECTVYTLISGAPLASVSAMADSTFVSATQPYTGVYQIVLPAAALAQGWHRLSISVTNAAGTMATVNQEYGLGKAALIVPSYQTQGLTARLQAYSIGGSKVVIQYKNAQGVWQTSTAGMQSLISGSPLKTAPFTWNIAADIDSNRVVVVRACVLASATTADTECGADASATHWFSVESRFTFDRWGEAGPSQQLGPWSVSLTSGKARLSVVDAELPSWAGSSTLSRSTSTHPGVTTGSLGNVWRLAAQGIVTDWRAVDDFNATAILYGIDDAPTGFHKISTTYSGGQYVSEYKPDTNASDLTLRRYGVSISSAQTFILTDQDNTETVFEAPSGAQLGTGSAPTTFALTASRNVNDSASASYSFDSSGRLEWIISPPPPAESQTPIVCTPTSRPVGCEALQLVYSTTGTLDRVVRHGWTQLATSPFTESADSAIVVCYSYAGSPAVLTNVWDPREQVGGGASCDKTKARDLITYGYTNDTSGNPQVTSVTTAGAGTWTLTLDSSGRATSASLSATGMPTLTTTIQYNNVNISATVATDDSHPDLSQSAASAWTQKPWDTYGLQNATTAVAVYGPGDNLTDLRDADITAFDANGKVVHTANYSGSGQAGWNIDTMVYDSAGRVVWELDAANRKLALAPSTDLTQWQLLGLVGSTSSAAADALASHTRYTLVAGIWFATDTWSPLHMISTPASGTTTMYTSVAGRTHSHQDYASVSTTDVPQYSLASSSTAATVGTSLGAPDVSSSVLTTNLSYRVVDTSGTINSYSYLYKSPADVSVGTIRTQTIVDQYGRTVQERQPSAVGRATGEDVYTIRYYSRGTNVADCESTAWWGQVCETKPQAGTATPATKFVYDWLKRPIQVTESVGGVSNVATTSFDNSGDSSRVVSTSLTATGAGFAVATTSFGYDTTTSQLDSISTPAGSLTFDYDILGRRTRYSDASGGVVDFTYDTNGRIATINRLQNNVQVAKSTYDYTSTDGEHRGMVRSVTHENTATTAKVKSVGTYDAAGRLKVQSSPLVASGLSQTWAYDTVGQPISLTVGDSTAVWLANTVSRTATGKIGSEANSATGQSIEYGYDLQGRLTRVDSRTVDGCERRDYGFDDNSNRTSLTSYLRSGDSNCGAGTVQSTVTSAFDASDRMTASTLTYDLLGRVTTLPEELSPVATPLTFDYYTNNLIHSTTNALRNTTDTYTLDPAQRLTCTRTSPVGASDTTSCGNTTTNTDTTNHYTNETSDSPAWTIEKTGTTTTTTFNATNLDGTLSATITGTTITHHIADLRGNTTLTTSSSLAQATTTSYTEYGTPQTPQTPTNAWHGAQQRTTSATTGLIHMGVRLYNSLTGLFLQQDPVHGGNPNTYTHPVDPINQMDLSGCADCDKLWIEIVKLAEEIHRRFFDLRLDLHSLPATGTMSVEGHKHQMAGKKRRLKELIRKYRDPRNCGGGQGRRLPPGVNLSSNVRIPNSIRSEQSWNSYSIPISPQQIGQVGGWVAVGIYVVYNVLTGGATA